MAARDSRHQVGWSGRSVCAKIGNIPSFAMAHCQLVVKDQDEKIRSFKPGLSLGRKGKIEAESGLAARFTQPSLHEKTKQINPYGYRFYFICNGILPVGVNKACNPGKKPFSMVQPQGIFTKDRVRPRAAVKTKRVLMKTITYKTP